MYNFKINHDTKELEMVKEAMNVHPSIIDKKAFDTIFTREYARFEYFSLLAKIMNGTNTAEEEKKYSLLCDNFNFEEGFISDLEFTVAETYTAQVMGLKNEAYPTITVSSDMTVLYSGNTFSLKAGKNVLYDMILATGVNELIFNGTGDVIISYTGGIL